MLALSCFKRLCSPLKGDICNKNFFFPNGGVVQQSFPLIVRFVPFSSGGKLQSWRMMFPLIEKRVHFCHNGFYEALQIQANCRKKTCATFIDKRGSSHST